MSPSELEEMLDELPFRPVRLTLTSGDQVLIERREYALLNGLSVVLLSGISAGARFALDYRLISVPNIVIAARADRPLRRRRRRP
jgi:hypothetical protein